jgi:predicted protein tyrosine phosphatase
MLSYQIAGLGEVTEETVGLADAVVSILEPKQPIPIEIERSSARTLILRFSDFEGGEPNGPRRKHVRELLAFATQIAPTDRLLVHCYAGISRSTASAAVILAGLSQGREYDKIFQSVGAHRRGAWPNAKIIELADRELRAHGAFIDALHRFYLAQYTRSPNWAPPSYRNPHDGAF